MSSTNKTVNYKLSQFIGTDKPTFLGDYNNDMQIIDGAIFEANQSAEQALNDVEAVKGAQKELKNVHTETQGQVAQLKEIADGMTGDVTSAQEAANSAEQKATEAQTAATGVLNAANAASVNATRAKQTADGNKTTLEELERRVAAIEATPKLDDITFTMSLGGWRPNISEGSVGNKYIFEANGRNKIKFNTTKLDGGLEFYFVDGTSSSTSDRKQITLGEKTFIITQPQVTILFYQTAQNAGECNFTATISKDK